MKLAFWPGLGGGSKSLIEVEGVLAASGIVSTVIDPRYDSRTDWSLASLADELAATGADVYAGHSWGAAVAATAAVKSAPRALILLDGGHVGPHDFPHFGGAATTDERVAEAREAHAGYRWPATDDYLAFCRDGSPRWNDLLEEAALEGMQYGDGEVLPPFDADVLERIVRGYEQFDPEDVLPLLDRDVRVLLIAAVADEEHAAAREDLLNRFSRLAPDAKVRRVQSGHDVIWGLGPELGQVIADWLLMEAVV